jgi:titin
VPDSPLDVTAVPVKVASATDVENVLVRWSLPSSDGGQPLVGFEVEGSIANSDGSLAEWSIMSPAITRQTLKMSAVISGLLPATSYVFRVYALTSVGRSGPSKPSLAVSTAKAVPKKPPVPPSVSAITGTSAVVSWDAMPRHLSGGLPIVRYELEQALDPSLEWVLVHTANANENAVELTGLIPGLMYKFRLRAANELGESEHSEPSVVIQTVTTVPGCTSRPKVERDSLTETSVTLRWRPPTETGGLPINDFEIWASLHPGSDFKLCSQKPPDGHDELLVKRTVEGLQPARVFKFKARALNAKGAGEFSSESVPQQMLSSVPRAVSTIRAEEVGTDFCHVGWDAPELDGGRPIFQYRVQMSKFAHFDEFTDLGCVPATGHERKGRLLVESLEHGKRYYFRVQAISELGAGEWSSPSAPIRTRFNMPSVVEEIKIEESTATTIPITFNEPSSNGGVEIVSYDVQIAQQPLGEWGRIFNAIHHPAARQRVIVDDLRPGTIYALRVRACNTEGPGQWLETPANAITKRSKPMQGGPPRVLSSFKDKLLLEWDLPDVDGGSSIQEVKLQVCDVPFESWRHVACTELHRTVANDLQPGRQYRFRIAAVNEIGHSDWSEPSEAFCTTTSVPTTPTALQLGGSAAVGTLVIERGTSEYDGNASATLTWGAPESDGGSLILSYEIEFATEQEGFGKWRSIAVVSPKAAEVARESPTEALLEGIFSAVSLSAPTTCVLESLPQASNLKLRVRAANRHGFGPWSEGIAVATRPTAPTTPDAPIPYAAGAMQS